MSTRQRQQTTTATQKLPLPELLEMKRRHQPITMVTAYDFPSAQMASEAGVDLILVGDSAAMTVLGLPSTVPATMDEMVMLTRAASRGASHPIVVADLPFLSYHTDDRDAILNSGRFVKEAGAEMVKMEGAGPILRRIRVVSEVGIPVVGHLGLTPQTATRLGGFRAQGRTADAAAALLADSLAVEAAGASALVLECVPAPVAAEISRRLTIPTIGIGAGDGCDGQVLVWHDLLGIGAGRPPRFVREYESLRPRIVEALEHYCADVRSRAFPADEHTYAIADEELAEFEGLAAPRQSAVRPVSSRPCDTPASVTASSISKRSIEFYCGALGFDEIRRIPIREEAINAFVAPPGSHDTRSS